jgi:hypothetical protein
MEPASPEDNSVGAVWRRMDELWANAYMKTSEMEDSSIQIKTQCLNRNCWEKNRYVHFLKRYKNTDLPRNLRDCPSVSSQLQGAIGMFFELSDVQSCNNSECEVFRQRCMRVIPSCTWIKFRENLVNWIACWLHVRSITR